jgi:hypothetical protein
MLVGRVCLVRAGLLLLVAVLAAEPGSAQRPAAPQPPPIAFGTNLGHWLSQATLDRAVMATFFTEADVGRIKGWGMDHIRLPVDYPLFASETDRETFSEEASPGWTRPFSGRRPPA